MTKASNIKVKHSPIPKEKKIFPKVLPTSEKKKEPNTPIKREIRPKVTSTKIRCSERLFIVETPIIYN